MGVRLGFAFLTVFCFTILEFVLADVDPLEWCKSNHDYVDGAQGPPCFFACYLKEDDDNTGEFFVLLGDEGACGPNKVCLPDDNCGFPADVEMCTSKGDHLDTIKYPEADQCRGTCVYRNSTIPSLDFHAREGLPCGAENSKRTCQAGICK